MTVDDDTFVGFSKGAFALLCLGLLIAIFALVRDDAVHRHKQAKAAEAAAANQRQRTKDNASYIEAQARSLADLDALANQLSAVGIMPVVSPQQAVDDAQPRPAPVVVSPVLSSPTTTTTAPARPKGSPGTTAPPPGPTTTSPPAPPTTSPPTPPPSQPCVILPAVGPIPGVSVCSGQRANQRRTESSSGAVFAGLGGGPLILIVIVGVLLAAGTARGIQGRS